MNPSDKHKMPADSSGQPNVRVPSPPGGYHSRGIPGEEGDLRKRMRVLKVGDRSQRINKSRPLKGGIGAARASSARLDSGLPTAVENAEPTAVFVIAKKGTDFLNTPVFHAGESGEEEAVALFTEYEQAHHYLARAGWGQTDEVGKLSSGDLLEWLVKAEQEGVRYAAVNPDRERQLTGEPLAVLALDAMSEESADNLSRQVMELARG